MSHKVVSVVWSVAVAGVAVVIGSGAALAESRAEVLERIRPVGQVAIEGQATAPAAVAEVTPAPVAEATPAAAPAPAAETTAPPVSPPTPVAPVVAAGGTDGSALYTAKGCVACHGVDAKSPIMPSYPKLAGLPGPYSANQMKDIKSGARSNGQAMVMKGIMASVSEEEIQAIAEWLSTL